MQRAGSARGEWRSATYSSVTGAEEPPLRNLQSLLSLHNLDERETSLAEPVLEERRDVLARLSRDSGKKIGGSSVTIEVRLEVVRDTLQEALLTDVVHDHLQARRSLRIRKSIKDLLDRVLVRARHLDGVGRTERVEGEGAGEMVVDEGRVDLPARLNLYEEARGLVRERRRKGREGKGRGERTRSGTTTSPMRVAKDSFTIRRMTGVSGRLERRREGAIRTPQVVPPLHRDDVAELWKKMD
jgi:hypothetical protein